MQGEFLQVEGRRVMLRLAARYRVGRTRRLAAVEYPGLRDDLVGGMRQ
jgi:hypothetical protein